MAGRRNVRKVLKLVSCRWMGIVWRKGSSVVGVGYVMLWIF